MGSESDELQEVSIGELDDGGIPVLNKEQLKRKQQRGQNIERMLRKDHVHFLIYPENRIKSNWDFFMTFVLIFSCLTTPLLLAFIPKAESVNEQVWFIINLIIDVLFGIDICLTFNTAIYNNNFQIIQNRKQIAMIYLKGWFTIDTLAIVPFEQILSATNVNGLVRFARIGRMYKLVKLTRLLRFLKLMRNKNTFMKQISDLHKFDIGFERLLFFMLLSLVLIHIVSCLWVMFPSFDDDGESDNFYITDTWLEDHAKANSTSTQIYFTSFYWTITTITTVGYGDIGGTNAKERLFCAIIMMIGVISFSFANSSLASILSNYDARNAAMMKKVSFLNKLYKEYCFPLELYIAVKKNIEFCQDT